MNEILENLIQENQQWPPKGEIERLDRYKNNLKLLLGRHSEVFNTRSKSQELTTQQALQFANAYTSGTQGSSTIFIPIPIPLIVGTTYSDLLFSSPISLAMETETSQKQIEEILERSDLHSLNLEQAIVCSILGDCVYEVKLTDGQASIGYVDPKTFIPIWNANDRNKLDACAISWKRIDPEDKENIFVVLKIFSLENEHVTLDRQIWKMEGDKLGAKLDWEPETQGALETETIELDEIPVVMIPNVRLGGNFGISDIGFGIDALIDELDNRFSQLAIILDVHANPAIRGPVDLIDVETGKVNRKEGYFPFDTSGVKPEYMVWNGQLEIAESYIDRLVTMISVATGIPASLFMKQISGIELSAKRLRLEFFAAINKAGRKRLNFDRGFKRLFDLTQKMENGSNKSEAVTINWQDGLPDDELEAVTIQGSRIANGIQSRLGAIMVLDDLSEIEAQAKLDQISEDEKSTIEETVNAMTFDKKEDQ